MKRTSNLSAGSSEDDGLEEDPLITVEAEAVLRAAVGKETTNSGEEDLRKKEDKTEGEQWMLEIFEGVPTSLDGFAVGTRDEVNGAAAFFFAAGYLIFGPFGGVAIGALGSHLAANKTGAIANFCRKCGDALDGIGKDKKNRPSKAIVLAQPLNAKPKSLVSRITDELVSGAEYVEGRLHQECPKLL